MCGWDAQLLVLQFQNEYISFHRLSQKAVRSGAGAACPDSVRHSLKPSLRVASPARTERSQTLLHGATCGHTQPWPDSAQSPVFQMPPCSQITYARMAPIHTRVKLCLKANGYW